MSKHDKIAYDPTFTHEGSFGVITCPKCEKRVLYGMVGKTRPKYCPDCEKLEFEKAKQSECFKKLTMEQRDHYIMMELRIPMPIQTHKTVQQLVDEVHHNVS